MNLPGTDVDKDCFKPSNDCLKTVSIENSSWQFSQIWEISIIGTDSLLWLSNSIYDSKRTVSVERIILSRGTWESYTQITIAMLTKEYETVTKCTFYMYVYFWVKPCLGRICMAQWLWPFIFPWLIRWNNSRTFC